MLEVKRSVRQKVVAGAAVAVLLGGASLAAVSATGQGNGRVEKHARHGARRLRTHDLAVAASYLGTSPASLASELRSGKSLAQIAAAHGSDKTASGLVEAIVAARKARLQKTAAKLPARVSAEVARPGGPTGGTLRSHAGARSALALFTAPGHLGAAAAGYLGVPLAELRSELHAGKTLAQLAAATPGKSHDGLVAALLAAKQQRSVRAAARSASGDLSPARGKHRAERVRKRVERLLARKFVRGSSS
ncbi:MAG TPA: hypothetical protein VG188_13225 [Solirubrobacteraceae bacterium]|nr:hypothetical protein [Solirubrobacteraceae bacterium]